MLAETPLAFVPIPQSGFYFFRIFAFFVEYKPMDGREKFHAARRLESPAQPGNLVYTFQRFAFLRQFGLGLFHRAGSGFSPPEAGPFGTIPRWKQETHNTET